MTNKKLYFGKSGSGNFIISDDGEIRRVLTTNPSCDLDEITYGLDYEERKVAAEKYLREVVEDDSSWEECEESVDELIEQLCEGEYPWRNIYAEIEKEL